MRITRDKLNKLAHVIADTLAETDEAEFLEDRNTVRQAARAAMEKLLNDELRLDAAARLKIQSQRKIVPEGSQEWDILYRKYYNDGQATRPLRGRFSSDFGCRARGDSREPAAILKLVHAAFGAMV